jgi:hypothetical protein
VIFYSLRDFKTGSTPNRLAQSQKEKTMAWIGTQTNIIAVVNHHQGARGMPIVLVILCASPYWRVNFTNSHAKIEKNISVTKDAKVSNQEFILFPLTFPKMRTVTFVCRNKPAGKQLAITRGNMTSP